MGLQVQALLTCRCTGTGYMVREMGYLGYRATGLQVQFFFRVKGTGYNGQWGVWLGYRVTISLERVNPVTDTSPFDV